MLHYHHRQHPPPITASSLPPALKHNQVYIRYFDIIDDQLQFQSRFEISLTIFCAADIRVIFTLGQCWRGGKFGLTLLVSKDMTGFDLVINDERPEGLVMLSAKSMAMGNAMGNERVTSSIAGAGMC
eukprot:scaffold38046_cov67-Cyclotella_meneghiniana.AAC.1